jgi:hypothetical protein
MTRQQATVKHAQDAHQRSPKCRGSSLHRLRCVCGTLGTAGGVGKSKMHITIPASLHHIRPPLTPPTPIPRSSMCD